MDTQAIRKQERARVGAVGLIGVGTLMLVNQLTPHAAHGALSLAVLAATCGGVYALGGARYAWARVPAIALSVISAMVFFNSLPGHPMQMLWPVLLVLAGLWILRSRDRTRWV